MRVIFSTNNPIECLYNLKHKYSMNLYKDYLEYLDAWESLKSASQEEAEAEAKRKAEQSKRR